MNKNLKIGISGNHGSFSEEAARYYCEKNKIAAELVYLISVENVLTALDKKEINMGIFPIENSNGGIVYESVYAMAKHNFEIENLFEIDIRHCLLSLPKIGIEDIKNITSHQQALKQCRMYLKRKWPDAELSEYSDTAEAAKDLADGKLPKNAAIIASRACAKIYDLEILEENIQDLKFNFTNFIVAK